MSDPVFFYSVPDESVDHTERDDFWGDGGGRGKNMLRWILLQVRQELRERKGEL